MHGERRMSQASATCAVDALWRLAIASMRPRSLALVQRKPRQEGKPVLLARVDHRVGRAVAEIVEILHRDDGRDLAGAGELARIDVREADMADLAGLLQIGERADAVFERHLGIDGVKLIKIDALELEPLQACLARIAQMRGPAIRVPPSGARPQKPALGRDDEALGIRMQRLGDRALADRGAI